MKNKAIIQNQTQLRKVKNNQHKKNHQNSKQKCNPRHNIKDGEDYVWLGGKNPCYLALKNKNRKIFEILVSKNHHEELKSYLSNNSLLHLLTIIKLVDNSYIDRVFDNNFLHQGIAIKASKFLLKNQFQLLEELHNLQDRELPTILILDQITDPQNVGAIIRSAVAFNFKKIIFCEHNSAKESASMIKASAGNIEFAEIYVATNINNLIEKLKKIGYWCAGLAGEGNVSLKKLIEYKNIALIVGSEGSGIRDLVKKNCDLLIKIDTNSEVESLNVSVATAIALNQIYNARHV